MRRFACGLAWAGVLYLAGVKIVGGVAGTWAAAHNPQQETEITSAAAAAAVEAGQFYLMFVVAVLVAAGTWYGTLPGTAQTPLACSSIGQDSRDGRNQRLNRLLARISMGLLAFFLTAGIALHLLRPEYDPCSRFLSEYVVGPYGDLMTAGLALSGASAVVLGLALQRSVTRSFWLVVGSTSLTAGGIGYILCALFPTDLYAPGGGPYRERTAAGVLHDNLATASATFATLAFVLLPWACRRCARWRPFFRSAVAFACAAAAAFVIGSGVPREYAGLGQRLWVATTAACCLLLAYRIWTVATEEVSEYVESEERQAAMS